MSALRVGTPPYLVARPLNEGLEGEPGLDLRYDVPARLVEGLRDGSLDVALVSSVELFRRPGYRYVAGPAVVGHGFVASVQVFHRGPLGEVETVALDPASRASQALVRIVLPRRLGRTPRFEDVPRGTDPAALGLDAWLEIGDGALRRYLSPGAPPAFNPSEAWTEDTGLPFVFAAWIVRPGVELETLHVEALCAAAARGQARTAELAAHASRAWSLPYDRCRRYLAEECRYDPGAELGPALLALRDAAAPLGLCLPDLVPEPIPVPSSGCPRA